MVETTGSYINDPLFKEVMEDVQQGRWKAGFDKIEELKSRYPENPAVGELQELQSELKLKAKFDKYEKEDRKRQRWRQILIWAAGVIATILIAWGLYASSSWIQEQFVNVRVSLLTEVQTVEAAVHYRDAQSFIEADRPSEAQKSIQKVNELNPDYPGLADLEQDLSTLLALDAQYQEATQLMGEDKFQDALQVFESIEEQHPGYKDVTSRIQEAQKELLLDRLLTQAEIARSDGDSIRALAPKFNTEEIQNKLVESYIRAAEVILERNPESMDALRTARDYFQKALIIRPMDEDVLVAQRRAISGQEERIYNLYLEKAQNAVTNQEDSLAALETAKQYFEQATDLKPNDPRAQIQLEFARTYLDAEDDFASSRWSDVIEGLEEIYVEEPDYAGGTARQMLYDAYLQRGDKRQAGGEYESALADFRRAAEIANDKPEGGTIRLYWAKIKIGEVLGIQGEYQQAVQLYSDAVGLVDLISLARGPDGDSNIARSLEEAERYANLNWHSSAFRAYSRVLPATEVLYTVEEYTLQENDYLSQLANQYETVTLAIMDQNNFSSPSSVDQGQTILIPTIREPGQ